MLTLWLAGVGARVERAWAPGRARRRGRGAAGAGPARGVGDAALPPRRPPPRRPLACRPLPAAPVPARDRRVHRRGHAVGLRARGSRDSVLGSVRAAGPGGPSSPAATGSATTAGSCPSPSSRGSRSSSSRRGSCAALVRVHVALLRALLGPTRGELERGRDGRAARPGGRDRRPPGARRSSATSTTARRPARRARRRSRPGAAPAGAGRTAGGGRRPRPLGARGGARPRSSRSATSRAASTRRSSRTAASTRPLSALAARAPVPRARRASSVPTRPPADVEAAAYFVVSEALANLARHSERDARPVGVTASDGRARSWSSPTTASAAPTRRGVRPGRPARAGRLARRRARRRQPARRRHDRRSRGAAVRVVDRRGLRRCCATRLARLLADYGIEVVAAVGDAPRSCVEPWSEHEPDVFVVDVRMPPTFTDEGIRAAAELRARRSRARGARALAVRRGALRRATCSRSGRDGLGYLLKDRVADGAEFVDALRRVAARRHGARPGGRAAACSRASPPTSSAPREREVLGLMAEGRSNAGIAHASVRHGGRGREAHHEHLPEAAASSRRSRTTTGASSPCWPGSAGTLTVQAPWRVFSAFAWIVFAMLVNGLVFRWLGGLRLRRPRGLALGRPRRPALDPPARAALAAALGVPAPLREVRAQRLEPVVPLRADALHPARPRPPAAPASAGSASRGRSRLDSTSPASPSAARCFATACRVTGSSRGELRRRRGSARGERLDDEAPVRVGERGEDRRLRDRACARARAARARARRRAALSTTTTPRPADARGSSVELDSRRRRRPAQREPPLRLDLLDASRAAPRRRPSGRRRARPAARRARPRSRTTPPAAPARSAPPTPPRAPRAGRSRA